MFNTLFAIAPMLTILSRPGNKCSEVSHSQEDWPSDLLICVPTVPLWIYNLFELEFKEINDI